MTYATAPAATSGGQGNVPVSCALSVLSLFFYAASAAPDFIFLIARPLPTLIACANLPGYQKYLAHREDHGNIY